MVELPLALPVIMAGIRTAAVWVIGTATLSTPIGQTSLGNYIFTGLQTQNWVFVLFGCVAAALLALVVDQLLALVETRLARRSRGSVSLGAPGLRRWSCSPPWRRGSARARRPIVIGAKTFTEQYILGALIAAAARASGLSTSAPRRARLDGHLRRARSRRPRCLCRLFRHALDQPDESHRRAAAQAVLDELGGLAAATDGITLRRPRLRERLCARDARARRRRRSASRRSPISPRDAPQMTIGGDYEFFSRPEWKALARGLRPALRACSVDQPNFMYRAVADGDVDVISAFSSDGRIAQYDLIVSPIPSRRCRLTTPCFCWCRRSCAG